MQTRETITKPQNEIEYQNDFTSEGGTLHGAVKTVMDKTNMLANTVETVKKARELGATIVYAPITFTEDYHELSPTCMASSRAWSTASHSVREPGARRSSTS